MNDLETKQRNICKKYNIKFYPTDLSLKVGIAKNVKGTSDIIHGLRIKEENATSGWYFWSGDWSDNPDFFLPLHGKHLHEWAENILPYLGLPEGYRFSITNEYEDVWEDKDILDESQLVKNYKHPHYGTFMYDEDAESWIPSDETLSFFGFECYFYAEDKTIMPNHISETLLTMIIENKSNILDQILQALWNNLNHIGRKSGLWWENEALEDIFESINVPVNSKELNKHIDLYAVEISNGIAEFRFHATFEEEHGIGILYDGYNVLGIGYTYSVTPFEKDVLL